MRERHSSVLTTPMSISEANEAPDVQVSTLIGYGSPNKAGSHDVHGAALGEPETEETRNNLQWKYPPFELPNGVKETMSRVEEVGPLCASAYSVQWLALACSLQDEGADTAHTAYEPTCQWRCQPCFKYRHQAASAAAPPR
jgi:transketolase